MIRPLQPILLTCELIACLSRIPDQEAKPVRPAPLRHDLTVEELSRYRRLIHENRKARPEWDRNTFEETGP